MVLGALLDLEGNHSSRCQHGPRVKTLSPLHTGQGVEAGRGALGAAAQALGQPSHGKRGACVSG